MASRYDITIDQNSTFTIQITLEDELGMPFDLTGCTAQAMIRYSLNDTSPAVTFTPLIDTINGIVSYSLTAPQTLTITRPKAHWSGNLIYPDGTIQRLAEGLVTLNPGATK